MHGVHKKVYAWCKPRRSRQEQMMVRHSLKSAFYFHRVLGILKVGRHRCSCHITAQGFMKLTLLLVVAASMMVSMLPELKISMGAVSTPEILIFNDEVN